VEKYLQNFGGCPVLRGDYQSIRDNTGNLYPAWSELGTPLKLIPLLGGIDENVLYKDQDSHPEISNKYTFRMMAGYLDSQSYLWTDQNRPDGPVEINPQYGFWSWVDRLNASCTLALCPYYPSYELRPQTASHIPDHPSVRRIQFL
jgi:hypothetical protein